MRAWLWIGCVGAAVVVGCAGSTGSSNGGNADAGDAASDDGGAGDDAADDAGPDKLTWTYIYTTYFGRGTPGRCGLAGCHGTAQKGFVCANQAGCYTSFTTSNPNVGGRMVNPGNPSASVLLDPKNSPVIWFSSSGNMPEGALSPNPTAKAEITAWIMAGAPNN